MNVRHKFSFQANEKKAYCLTDDDFLQLYN